MEEIIILRKQQVERGMQKKTENEQNVTQLREKNELLKRKIKARTDSNAKAENTKSSRNVERDLLQWRKKCDELKARTQKKRQ